MPGFLYPLPLALIAGLIALPIVIHLINLMRHRRVRWAAMEFLMVSQKRNRTWVMLKQLLLLLLRVAVVAGVLLLVTQPIVQSKLAGLFGGGKVHHIVLLDDSYSMSDRWADSTAFDEAKKVIGRLATQAVQQPAQQEFTLLRFSQASRPGRGTQPDLVDARIESDEFIKRLDDLFANLNVSQMASGPADALQAAAQMVGEGSDANHIVYLVSDFRAKEWTAATELQKLLQKLNAAGAQLQLINCVDDARPNLAITALHPAHGTRAAGVPLQMELTVHNYGAAAATNVSVRLDEQGTQRPAVEFDKIEPGRSVTRQFEIRSPNSGQRRISAYLPADPVLTDNVRHAVIDFPSGVPVLIIDGAARTSETQESDGYFLESAMSQPGPVPTGLRPRIESPRFLDDHPLDDFHAIYLCNVERLSSGAVDKLTKYVESGGGLAFFVGDKTRADFFNQLYADDQGLFPVPLESPVPLLVDRSQKSPDLQLTVHPIFRVFTGDNNPFIKMVNVGKYFAVRKGWKPAEGSSTQIIARLRNGAPLAIEKKLGDGRVVAVLTTAGPGWNNWARANPSYVVTILELQGYLSAQRQTDASQQVGDPLNLPVDTAKYQEQVEFATPTEGPAGKTIVQAEKQDQGPPCAILYSTETSGVYEAQLTSTDNTKEIIDIAYNVDAAEGDLALLTPQQLGAELADVAYEYHRAGDLFFDDQQLQGFSLSETVLFALVFLLIAEQLLAYSASYHPSRMQGAHAG